MALTIELPGRRPSRAARWALRLALLQPALWLLAILAYRADAIATSSFLLLLMVTGLVCVLTLVLILAGLRSLWVHGSRGGRRLSWTIIVMIPLAAPFVGAGYLWIVNPVAADVSTDQADPPAFAFSPAVAPVAAEQGQGTGRRFRAPLDVVLEVADGLARDRGWTPLGQRGRVGADDTILVDYAYRVPVLHLPVQIVVRSRDEGDTARVDVRARMADLYHDLGFGAVLIARYLDDLDFAMIGLTDPEP
ncbi:MULTISPECIES: hypothetical protein [unclassified Roseitalea]|uniref:hypothetical protein n=1 Tax=unclassified Roseitalea TaxID=2639107 RepID=UPI00273F4B12|nr:MULTISPECIES: hypothetical protein [unclassified Roseitalea]